MQESITPQIYVYFRLSDENDEQHAVAMGIKGFLMKTIATDELAMMAKGSE